MNTRAEELSSTLLLRPAHVTDVPLIMALIDHWAGQGRMLKRPLPSVFENLSDFVVAEASTEVGPMLVGTVALHTLWSDIAEIRCLAVNPAAQASGLGRQLVGACETRAGQLGITQVFAWTLAPGFFEKCGYLYVDKADLHPRVEAGCRRCPLSQGCHENGMIKSLAVQPPQPTRRQIAEGQSVYWESV